ncbi:hypothetical protein DSUL_100005 [Desulfovibrionales bacterium]
MDIVHGFQDILDYVLFFDIMDELRNIGVREFLLFFCVHNLRRSSSV